jgi:hypothetical protein
MARICLTLFGNFNQSHKCWHSWRLSKLIPALSRTLLIFKDLLSSPGIFFPIQGLSRIFKARGHPEKLVGYLSIFVGQWTKSILFFFKLTRCISAGYVSPQTPHCNASKTEYISTSPNPSVNYGPSYT